MSETINFEDDYLVVHKDMHGKFSHYRWYPAEKAGCEHIEALIVKWNEGQKTKGEDGRPAELITDSLIRGICAYREQTSPLTQLLEDAKEVQKSIDEAAEYLESALADLNRIRGLE